MEADRRIVVTLPLVLEGGDTQSEPEDLIAALREELVGFEVVAVAGTWAMHIVATAEELHYNDVRRGRPA